MPTRIAINVFLRALLAVGSTGLISLPASGSEASAPHIEYGVFDRGYGSLPMAAYATAEPHFSTGVVININTSRRFQAIEGIGGAFNEMGGEALTHLDPAARTELMNAMFDARTGAGFTFCRIPVGASDFAMSAYSLNDSTNDYAMENFSIERDRQYLIPFITNALGVNPSIRLHASPWSPPGWMKTNGRMTDGGQLRDDPAVYASYALYLRKFIEEYRGAGITIDRLFVQNEPNIEMNYPTCRMEPTQMVAFVTGYLYPAFFQSGLHTEIWAGTYQEGRDHLFAHQCLAVDSFRHAVSGSGFQYSDPRMVLDVRLLYPTKGLMHTESKCYDGANSIPQAEFLFQEIAEYMNAGCSVYTYWNMILNEKRSSSWGWPQNSLVTIDREHSRVRFNPDFAVMGLISRWVKPGSLRCEAISSTGRATLAFINPDDTLAIFTWSEPAKTSYQLRIDNQPFLLDLPTNTICAIVIKPEK